MNLTTVGTMKSEIFTPITPSPVWAPLKKELKDCVVGIVTAGGVHLKTQTPYKTNGDRSWRAVPRDVEPDELMVTHGGYDHTDVNKDINCMWPYQRYIELEKEGYIKHFCDMNAGFMGGGGDVNYLKTVAGPAIAKLFKDQGADIVILTAG